jgi:hypothetical protein
LCPPEDIRDWARAAAKRHKEIKKHKDLAKNLDSKLQGGDDCAIQLRIDEGLLGKKITSRSLVDEKFAAWIYNTMQSFDVAGHDLKELFSYITKYVTNPGGSALVSADLPTRYCAVVCM